MTLAAKSCLGLDDTLKQFPGNAELATCEPNTSALKNDGNVRALGDEVNRSEVLVVSIGEDLARLRVEQLNIPGALPDRKLDIEGGVLGVIGLTIFALGKLQHRCPE